MSTPTPPNFLCPRPTAASAVLCLADAGIAELPDRLGREMRVLLAALWLIAVSPVGEGFLEVIEKNKCFPYDRVSGSQISFRARSSTNI